MSNFEDVKAFHKKFNLPCPDEPHLLDDELFMFRVNFMVEELNELIQAAGYPMKLSFVAIPQEGAMFVNPHEQTDALIDLAYVVMGTAVMMGLPWQDLWNEVHGANMQKIPVESAAESKRGSKFDLKKPAGWIPPQHSLFLPFNHSGSWPILKGE